MQGLVLGTLGGIAMLLAALGVYGAMALMVAERRREIAIRVALGSSAAAVLRLVLGRGLGLALLGVGVGLPLALALTTFLSSVFLGACARSTACCSRAPRCCWARSRSRHPGGRRGGRCESIRWPR